MEFINNVICWLEANWGQALFGTISLGSAITLIIMFVKSWLANKMQGTKYETMWNTTQESLKNLKDLYDKEVLLKGEAQAENIFLQTAQNVMFDALMKIVVSSKMDPEDKISIVANVERLKTVAPKELLVATEKKVEAIVGTTKEEAKTAPAQMAYDVVENVSSLLKKYSNKEI